MTVHPCIASLSLALALTATAEGEPERQLLMGGCGLGKLMLLNHDDSVAWEIEEPREVSDLWLLDTGNIVHSTKHGYQEIKPDYKSGKGATVVWSVDAPAGSECHACQPIGDDRYLVGYSSKPRSYMAEVDSKGKAYKTIEVPEQQGRFHQRGESKFGR